MKTTGLTIQEAIQAVKDGRATQAGNSSGTHFYRTMMKDYAQYPINVVMEEWSLIDPAITPSPGEVWKAVLSGWHFLVLDRMKMICQTGAIIDVEKFVIHGQNGWARVYDPKEAKCNPK